MASHPRKPDNLRIQITNRLAALRKEQNLTLKELGRRAELSETYLSRLENYKAPLPIEHLAALAKALSVPIEMFFSSSNIHSPLVLTRKNHGKQALFRGQRKAELLAHEKIRKVMEPFLIIVDTMPTNPPLQEHSGQEFNYILEGSCILRYGSQKYVLEQGDSVYYDAEVPHGSHALNGRPCLMLAVVGSNEYSFHGDLIRLLNAE